MTVRAVEKDDIVIGGTPADTDIEIEVDTDEVEGDEDDDEKDGEDEGKADADKPGIREAYAREKAKRVKAEAELRRLKKGDSDSAASATEEVETRWAGRFKSVAARGALAEAGVPKDKLARAVKMLDLDGLDVDDEGEVDGLDAEIDALKEDVPEFFVTAAEPPKKTAPNIRRAGDTSAPTRKKSSADLIADKIRGR